MEQIQKIFKILAGKNRLRILALLSRRSLCVCELAHVLGVSGPSVSRHLKRLKDAGLIEDLQDGLWTNYVLKKARGREKILFDCLGEWFKTNETAVADSRRLDTIDRKRLCTNRTAKRRKI